jgi:hypothetical protein
MTKRYGYTILALLIIIFLSGCHLDIQEDVDYPADLFRQTMKKIQTLQAKDPGRKGLVSNLNILVYVSDDRELISLSFPTAAAKEALKNVSSLENLDQGEKLGKYVKKLDNVKWEKLELLDRLGPGLLVEVEVDEEKDYIHALIWLD